MESIPLSTASLRERAKAKRHRDIVTAAADLWREFGIDAVSLSQIAGRAEVAPQTIYNLIGGIDSIGFAVIRHALEKLEDVLRRSSSTGVALAIELAQTSAEQYIADSRLYRQVLVRVPRVLFDGTHLGRDTAQPVIGAIVQARNAGEIDDVIDPDRLGRTIYVNYLGALYDWACGDSDDGSFRRAVEVAVLAPATACATASTRTKLAERLFAALAVDTGYRDIVGT